MNKNNKDSEKEEKQGSSIGATIIGGIIGAAAVGLGVGLYSLFSGNKETNKEETTTGQKDDSDILKIRKKRSLKTKKYTYTDEDNVSSFICPITNEIMEDPVITPDGITYEREAIEEWLINHDTDPMTKNKLSKSNLVANLALKNAIEDYFNSQETKP